nr:hypothetical protein [Tanacetum cinerariifolium]
MGDAATQTRSKRASKVSNDPLLTGVNTTKSGEDSLKLIGLMELFTKLQERVFDLETTKTTQAMEIESLERRLKKLKKRKRSRTHGLKRLYKVGLLAREESSKDECLDIFGVNDDDVIVKDSEMLFDVADDLRELKIAKPKATTTTVATIITTASSRPKAKGIVIRTCKEIFKERSVMLDEELAFKLHAEEKEERIARLQAEEQDALTDAKKTKLFMEFLEKRRKFFASKRAKEKRNRPPTKA